MYITSIDLHNPTLELIIFIPISQMRELEVQRR